MGTKELTIVGIGASAGGLEALQGFVKNLPTNTNITYILAQHLSPTYKSMMVNLLAKDSTIKIKEASNGDIVTADTMYICPPNKNIIVEDDKILIIDPKQLTYGPKPSINILFESIAANKGNKAIGIILSGTGSDGSRGVRAIKAEGGFTIVQQPQNAKYDGMPNSAINTGNIDLILDVEVMGDEIVELLKYPDRAESLSNINDKNQVYRNILAKLQRNMKVDFTLYKSSTIQRRIERRMVALKLAELNDYYDYIMQQDNSEIEALFNDILIGVTSFFRDEDAYDALKDNLSKLIEKKENKNIRIWSPGCSTGEEAYSIAIILSELLGKDIVNYKIQIFATDIDDSSTRFARGGRYPESSLMNVDKNLVKKYFMIKNEEYEIIKPVRDMCIFSRHDITNDPAFMRLDLISCRNLLIYFTSELQSRIFPMFHYSLNDDGILFLGKSESVGNFNHQFKTIDKKWKLYKAVYIGQKSAPLPLRTFDPKPLPGRSSELKAVHETPTISDMMLEYIQRHIMPKCVVVNDTFDLIFIKGNNPYLVRPEGEITQNIFKNVRPELSVELRAALHQCKKEANLVKTQYQKIIIDNEAKFLRLLITPLDNSLTNNIFLICFQEEELESLQSYEVALKHGSDDKEIDRLELELMKTKEHLQTVIEELETSNEEMQGLNEELQSSNEELQSSNEELETTNEELQSTNEELQTAYTEMRAMYEERDKDAYQINLIKNDIENMNYRFSTVLESSEMGVFDLDLRTNETLFVNEKWAKIFGYTYKELESIKNLEAWFKQRIHPDDLELRNEYFEKLILGKIDKYTVDLRVLNKDNEYIWIKKFIVGLSENEKPIRALGTIVNINDRKLEFLEKEITSTKLNSAIEISNMGTWEYDIQKDEVWWNNLMYEIFEIPKATKLDLDTIRSFIVEEDRKTHEDSVNKTIDKLEPHDVIFRINTKSGMKRILAKGNVITDNLGKAVRMVGIVHDITENYKKDLTIEDKKIYLETVLNTSLNGIYVYNFAEQINTYINPEYTQITGYTLNDLHTLSEEEFIHLFHPEEFDMIVEHMTKVKNSKIGEYFEVKYRFKHKDGHFIKLISRDCLIESKENLKVQMIGTFKEI